MYIIDKYIFKKKKNSIKEKINKRKLFSDYSKVGWCENVHEDEKSAEASSGEGDQMV